MADNTIQLLNNSLNQSAMLYRTVDEQLTKNLQVQQQAGQFDVQMKAKALAFAEEQRMNELRAEEMRATNDIRAKQFDLQKQLMPLKIEEANLQLESAKFAMTKQKDAFARQAFNDITAIYDDSAAYSLIETQSPDQARELLQHKAKWRGLVANGQPFSEEEYAKGIHEINSRYKDVKPVEGKVFDEKTHFLLGEISPKVQRVYEMKNPIVSKNRNMILSAYLDTPDSGLASFKDYEGIADLDVWGIAGATRMLYQVNKRKQSENFQEYQKLMTAASALGEGEEVRKKEMIAQAQIFKNDAEQALKENMLIQSNFRAGKFTDVTEEDISKAETRSSALPTIDPTTYASKPSREIAGIRMTSDPLQKELVDKVNDLDRKLGGSEKTGPSPFLKGYANGGVLDLEWYNNRTTNILDYKSVLSIKERIEENIDEVKDINQIVNQESINDVLSSISSPKEIPISEFLKDTLGSKAVNYGTLYESPFLRVGRKQGKVEGLMNGATISSFDDINNLISNIKNPIAREAARKEIYAAVATAGLQESIEQ